MDSLNKPIFGICLGMQIVFDESHEFGHHEGIGLIKGKVLRLPESASGKRLKVPQIGWHAIYPPQENERWAETPLKHVKPGAYMHFVHSYYVVPEDQEMTVAKTTYGDFAFCSAVARGNLLACQFHPERSGPVGIGIYKSFMDMVGQWKPSS